MGAWKIVSFLSSGLVGLLTVMSERENKAEVYERSVDDQEQEVDELSPFSHHTRRDRLSLARDQ